MTEDQQTIRRRLVITEVIWFIVGGGALVAYFYDPGFITIGILFILEYVLSVISTILWLRRTEQQPASQTPDTRQPTRNLSP